jgi:hypothetical protein
MVTRSRKPGAAGAGRATTTPLRFSRMSARVTGIDRHSLDLLVNAIRHASEQHSPTST